MFLNYVDALEQEARAAARDADCYLVATGTALLLAGLASAGATTAVSLYAQHKQGEANDQGFQLQSKANTDQLDYLKQKETQDQANFDKTFEENRREWQATQDRNYGIYQAREAQLAPYRAQSLNASNTLADLLGFPRGSAPAPSATGRGGAESHGPAAHPDAAPYLQTLLSTGTAIPDAIKKTNEKFGLTTGNEAMYYDDTKTIGLPDSYLVNGDQGWKIQPRGAEGPSTGPTGPSARNLSSMQPTLGQFMPKSAMPSVGSTDSLMPQLGGGTMRPAFAQPVSDPNGANNLWAMLSSLRQPNAFGYPMTVGA